MKAGFVFITVAGIVISSCSRSTERTLLGKWNASDNGFYIENSIFLSDTSDASEYGTMTFREGGTGSFIHDNTKEDIEWVVEKEEVTLTVGSEEPRTFTVLLDASEYQTWKYEKIDSTITNGLTSKEEWISLLKLTKIKTDF
ncbi:MAG: hypothetical protein ACJA0Q_001304 [Saprospiraceae bacterium]|jgi:hypothetical protein